MGTQCRDMRHGDRHRDTRRAGMSTGTLRSQSTRGLQAHGDTKLTKTPGSRKATPRCSLGSANPSRGRQGVTSRWHKQPGSVWGCTLPAPGVRVPCERPLSQDVSPDPLNHWKIRQGWQTGGRHQPRVTPLADAGLHARWHLGDVCASASRAPGSPHPTAGPRALGTARVTAAGVAGAP